MPLSPMKNAPVCYVVGQLRFNVVSNMGDYIDKIQDGFRKLGYTLFEVNDNQSLQLNHMPDSIQGNIVSDRSWRLTASDRKSGFILGKASVVFHTTHYESRDSFFDTLLAGFSIVNTVVELEHVSRVGLRYLDAILPSEGESVNHYFKTGFFRLPVDGVLPVSDYLESAYSSDVKACNSKGMLVTRVRATFGVLGYPPDMVPHGLVPMNKFNKQEKCQHAMLDLDHYVNKQILVDGDLRSVLVELHDPLENAFLGITSDYALEMWK